MTTPPGSGSEATTGFRAWLRRFSRGGLSRGLSGALCTVLALAAVVRIGAWLIPLPDGFFEAGSQIVTYEDDSIAHVFLSTDDKWRISTRDDRIDSRYLQALLQLEDRRFFSHGGVDMLSVARAAWTNLSRGRVVSGASTITMQLVRVREPRPRTVVSKVMEAFRAWQIEARYDKAAILGLYLTYVPYGRNVEGIEAASLTYFGHRPNHLSPDEMATLLAVPQNPTKRYPSAKNQARLRRARDRIAEQLRELFDPERSDSAAVVEEIKRTPVPVRLRSFPRTAHHAAYWLRARAHGARIATTLDRGVQRITAAVMTEVGARVRPLGIHNGVAVVVEHATGEIRALVGNFDFWDADHGGQIAGFDRPRSPGSTLKPFLYALGIDQGRVLPAHLVADVPRRYGTYGPKNFDGRYDGLVRLEDALARSLNVPFVDLLASIGVDPFVGHLDTWGVASLVDEAGFYGLSAAIGGLELSPLELATLYVMLARNGRYRPVRVVPDVTGDPSSPDAAMFAPGAAFLTQRALRRRDRPDFPNRGQWSGVSPEIHWKTGTSYGHRDAWAAGSDDRFTVVVWLGNFDNSPSRHLVGAQVAGPVLFDVLEALSVGRPPAEPPEPTRDLSRVEVCRFSGRPATRACPHRTHVWALTRKVPTTPCPYHVAVDVDKASGLAMRPGCRQNRAFDTRRFLRLPSSVRRWMSAHHRDLPGPPDWAPGCRPRGAAGQQPRITSPAPGQVALLIPGLDPKRQEIPLEAESGSQSLSWFVDGRFLGTVPADRPLWWSPAPGRHDVVVVDEAGASSRRRFRVAGNVGAR